MPPLTPSSGRLGRFANFAIFATLATLASAGTGCATLLKDPQQTVTVTSASPGTPIYVDGIHAGVTPARIRLSAKDDHVITVRGAAGEQSCRLGSSASVGWVVLGIVASPSWLVDLITGAWRSLDITECTLPV